MTNRHILRDQEIDIDSVEPHPDNYNDHPSEQIAQLAASLEQFGQIRAIVVKGRYVYAGNGLWSAACSLGWRSIRADILTDDYSDELARAYMVADNETARGGKPNDVQLLALLEEVARNAQISLEALGQSPNSLADLRQRIAEAQPRQDVPDVPPRWSEAMTLAQDWKTEAGQIWQLGQHRLGIGSAFDAGFVEEVQAGQAADQLLTDPPYGVDYGDKAEGLNRIRKGPSWQSIEGDQSGEVGDYRAWFADFLRIPNLAHYNTVYVCMNGLNLYRLREAFDDAGITWGDYLVWVKHCPVLTRTDYHTQHEFIVYGWRGQHKRRVPPGTSTVIDDGIDLDQLGKMTKNDLVEMVTGIFRQSNVLRFDRPMRHERHPTAKPLDLITDLVEQGCLARGIVIDIFAGSGTTILAAERANRICHAIELRPEYAAVILERWKEATDIAPILI